jgi:4-amino-4-deoxy-L-arabinose transferase-like glycosyltransferase
LLDKTKARYAEIARIMWDTNQWIMPQIDYGIPFWAKPPLSTWLSAGSYFLLGLMSLHQGYPPFTQYLLILTGKMVKKSGLSFTYLVLFY